MLRLFYILLSLLIVNCTIHPVMIPTVSIDSKPVTHRITWDIDVPDDWIIEKYDDAIAEDILTTVYEAQSQDPIGQTNAIVTVGTVSWLQSEGTSQNFAEMLIEILRQEPSVHVIHDNIMKSTSLVIFTVNNNILITQIMIVKQGIGYVVLCGGDANEHEKISETCRNIVTSFILR